MTLTHEDLSAISQLLDFKFKAELQPLKEDVQVLKEDVQMLKEDVQMLKEKTQLLTEDVQMLKEDVQMLKEKTQLLTEDVQMLKEDVQILKEETQGLKKDVQRLDLNVHNINLHLENVTDNRIQLLAENYVPAAKRFEKASAQIESMQIDIDVLKRVTSEHSAKLQKIS